MEGFQLSIWMSTSIPWFAALIALSLRIWARRITKVTWWFDDYFACLAFILGTGYTGIMVEWTLHTYLGAKVPYSLPEDEREAIFQQHRILSFFNSLCYASSLGFSKIAILCLYWRLFKVSHIKIPILILIGIVVVWIILRTFMLIFRCVPVQSLWDLTITDKVCNINPDQFFLGTITTHFILDIIILTLPIIEVVQLRMRTAQKVAVAALFLIGIIVCIASAIVLAILVNFPVSDQPTYDYAMFCVWGSVEVNIAIVSTCFPLLRPVASKVFPKGFFSSYANKSYPLSGKSYHDSRSRNTNKPAIFVRPKQARDMDDSSSTHQLADLKHGRSFDSVNKQNNAAVHTMITSQDYPSGQGEHYGEGITVVNSTHIEYDSRV